MKLDTWNIISLGLTTLVVLAGLVKGIRKLVRYWPKDRKPVVADAAESKGESISFFSLSLIGLTIAFSALLLLSVHSQPSIPSRAMSLLAAVAAAANVLAVLLVLLGIPAYKYTLNLKKEYERLDKEVKALREQNQGLTERVGGLEAQIKTKSLAPVQVPVARKPSVSRKKTPQGDEVSTSRRRSDKNGKQKGKA
jgi:hypothetical protein